MMAIMDFNQVEADIHFFFFFWNRLFDYLTELCSNQLLSHKWLRKLAEIVIYKTAAKGAKLFYRLINQSLDIYEKNDLTNRSYIPELKSSLDLAFQGVQQNILEKQEIKGQMIHLFTAVCKKQKILLK